MMKRAPAEVAEGADAEGPGEEHAGDLAAKRRREADDEPAAPAVVHEAAVKTEVLADDEDDEVGVEDGAVDDAAVGTGEDVEGAEEEELLDDENAEMGDDGMGLADMDGGTDYSTLEPMAVQGVARVPIAGFAPLGNSVVASPGVVGAAAGTCRAQDSLVGAKLVLERVCDVERVVLEAAAAGHESDAAAAAALLQMPRAALVAHLRAQRARRDAQRPVDTCTEDVEQNDDEDNEDEGDDENEEEDNEEEDGERGDRRPEWYDVERVLRGNANIILNLYLMQIQRLSTTKFNAEDELAAQLAVNLATLVPLATAPRTAPAAPPPQPPTDGASSPGAAAAAAADEGRALDAQD